MGPATIQQLLALNRTFYAQNAARFAAHRERPWPGWQQVYALTQPRTVLDVGCGHGRFAQFLAQKNPNINYLGLDFSTELLALRPPLPSGFNFATQDLSQPILGSTQYHLVAAFGLIHHLPSYNLRSQFIQQLSVKVAPGGWLALTFWALDAMPHWERLVLPWTLPEREPGDYLLSFAGSTAPRYCHHATESEVEAHARALAGECHRFAADGFNRYLVWRRPPAE